MAAAEMAAAEEEVRPAAGFPVEAPERAALLVWVRTVVCWHPVARRTMGSMLAVRIFFIG
jgi:hypothetical protein